MDIKYKFGYGTKVYIICDIFGFEIFKNEMFIKKVNTECEVENDSYIFNISYNLTGMFVDIDVNEEDIDSGKAVIYDNCSIYLYTNEKDMLEMYNNLIENKNS